MARGTIVVVALLTGFAALTVQSLHKMSMLLDERIGEYNLSNLKSGVIVVGTALPEPIARAAAPSQRIVRAPALQFLPAALQSRYGETGDYNPITPSRCSLPVPAHKTEEASAILRC
jgi:hypothetical protein